MIDPDRLEELRKMGDANFFQEMVELFNEQTRSLVKEITGVVENKNAPETQRLAHRLKGASLSMGAKELVAICQQIENAGKTKTFENAEFLLKQLMEIGQRTTAELLRLRPS